MINLIIEFLDRCEFRYSDISGWYFIPTDEAYNSYRCDIRRDFKEIWDRVTPYDRLKYIELYVSQMYR